MRCHENGYDDHDDDDYDDGNGFNDTNYIK